MSQRLRLDGVPMFEFCATTQNFSPAIVELDAAMRPAGCAMMAIRCLRSVTGKLDRWGNLYPAKQRSDQKVDAAVALMMAIGRAMSAPDDAGLEAFLSRPISVQ